MARFQILFFFLLAICSPISWAQLSFQINNYEGNINGAGNQNWDISGDGDQRIFVANNFGLLVLENKNTNLYHFNDQTIFRSVAFIDNKIYSGSFEDFGYWTEDNNENLVYTSLAEQLENPDMNNDAIWKIVKHEESIYFHSFGSIYCYNGESVFRLETSGTYMFLYKVGDMVYTQKVGDGLFKLEENKFIPINGSNFLNDEEIRSIINLPNGNLMIASTEGVYSYNGSEFKKLTIDGYSELIQSEINVVARSEDKIFIGTILNGIYVYDLNFKLLKNITTDNQLNNDTILSLKVDDFGNIWVGMDNGVSYIAFDAPLQTYKGITNEIGSVYAASLFNDELYVGTNKGIYRYKKDNSGNFYDKNLIPDSQGQVWFLTEIDGMLYGGLNDGTYLIRGNTLTKVSNVSGGYTLKSHPNNQEVLLQSTYSDVVVYTETDDFWKQSHILTGYRTPARFMEVDHLGNIWLGHTVKGIYQLQPDISFTSIKKVQEIGEKHGLLKSTNRIFKFDGRIATSYGDSLFEWDTVNEQFIPYTELNPYFTTTGTIRNILPAGKHRYWVIKRSEINLFEIHFNSVSLLYTLIPEMYDFQMVEGYENIISLDENIHLISLDDGFAVLNLENINRSKYPRSKVEIKSAIASNSKEKIRRIASESSSEEIILSNAYSNITLNWFSTQVVGNPAFFQYKLDGLESTWSDWTLETMTRFERLLPGSYTFLVRSIGTNGVVTETTQFTFKISKPWHLTKGAYMLYFLIFVSLTFMVRLYISRKQWRTLGKELEQKHKNAQRDQEKAEKEVIKLKNEKLQSEVEHKSAQLASNTMAIIRKNNLLASLKDELNKQKKELGKKLPSSYYNRIYKLIEKGIEDENEWEIFEQLYDQAHGNFFKRLKETYPQLTPSDLRLCAYLRMNLASKEIAPLLNISVRGVEERRYRLRKRMNLPTEVNLTELIMTF